MCETFKINFRGKLQTLSDLHRILAPSGKVDGAGGAAFLLFSAVCFPAPRTSIHAIPQRASVSFKALMSLDQAQL